MFSNLVFATEKKSEKLKNNQITEKRYANFLELIFQEENPDCTIGGTNK